jgi:cytidine deaminase
MLTNEERENLIETACEVREWAYAPYSQYKVGAALLAASGKVYFGVNIENAAYPAGMCAERVAIFKAVSEGENQFIAIALATRNGGSPCGICRQVMAEFGLDTQVLIADKNRKLIEETTVSELLPNAFTPAALQKE